MLGFSPIASQPIASAPSAAQSYTMTADAGSFSMSGQSVALNRALVLVAAAGAFVLAGQDIAFSKALNVAIDAGSFALAGQDVALNVGRVVALGAGSFALAGQDVALSVSAGGFALQPGVFVLSGQDVAFVVSRTLSQLYAGPINSVLVSPAAATKAVLYGYTTASEFMPFFVKQNDTAPSIRATLYDGNGSAVNLSGASVKFNLRAVGSSSTVVSALADIVTAASGIVQYDWQAGDTATVGIYHGEFEVTFSGGLVETFPNGAHIRVEIHDDVA